MPTSSWRRAGGLDPIRTLVIDRGPMPAPLALPYVTTMSKCCLGEYSLGSSAAVSWTTNLAHAYPFALARPFVVNRVFWFNGATATTDNADVGVYSEAGALLVSSGATAISGASQLQSVDVTDTLLQPGRYYLAYSQSGATATPQGFSNAAMHLRQLGVAQMATAHPLPSTFTFAAATTQAVVLYCGITGSSLI